ncbi:hypothetical protein L1887_22819 [Cichorium endivia]|nr:hypothetical protein L1887_22819 [Cichorium endivia]
MSRQRKMSDKGKKIRENSKDHHTLLALLFSARARRDGEISEPTCKNLVTTYKEFVKAVVAYQKKVNNMIKVKSSLKLDDDLEQRRKLIVHSFSLARNIHATGNNFHISEESDLKVGAEFLQLSTALSLQQQKRLKKMCATIRNASSYVEKMKLNEEREKLAKVMM